MSECNLWVEIFNLRAMMSSFLDGGVCVCMKFQDRSLIMKLKISWAANSLKTVIVFSQWTKRVPDLKLLKFISQKLVIWRGNFSSKIWHIQITMDTVPTWVTRSMNYWQSFFFLNNTKRYLILNLSNSSSLILKPFLVRLSYPLLHWNYHCQWQQWPLHR